LERVYDTMTNEILLRYLNEEFLSSTEFESVEPMESTERFFTLRSSAFTQMHLNQMERNSIGFRSADPSADGFRLFCYFGGEINDESIEIEKGAITICYE